LPERALKNCADIATAQAALGVAQANLTAGKGAYFPTVTGNFSATRQMSPVTPRARIRTAISSWRGMAGTEGRRPQMRYYGADVRIAPDQTMQRLRCDGPVAQAIEQRPSKLWVAGSNPAGVAKPMK
jgi:outer membrane protein TolC